MAKYVELSSGNDDKDDWKPVLLIVELVMSAPQSNAVLERFLSQLKYIKANTRASLSNTSLNLLLCVKVSGQVLQEYHNKHVEVVGFWYNAKNRRTQNKKKQKKI